MDVRQIGVTAVWGLVVFTVGAVRAEVRNCVWKADVPGLFSVADNWEDGVVPVIGASVTNTFNFSALTTVDHPVTNDVAKELKTLCVIYKAPPGSMNKIVAPPGTGAPFSFVKNAVIEVGDGATFATDWNFAPWGGAVAKRGPGALRINTETWGWVDIRVEEGRLVQTCTCYNTPYTIAGGMAEVTGSTFIAPRTVGKLSFSGAGEGSLQLDERATLAVGAYSDWDAGNLYGLTLPAGILGGTGAIGVVNGATLTVAGSQPAFAGIYAVLNSDIKVAAAETRIIAHYGFDDSKTKDASQNGVNLTSWHADRLALVDDDERGGKVLQLTPDATEHQAEVHGSGANNSHPLMPTGNVPFTVSLWLKFRDVNAVQAGDIFLWGKNEVNGQRSYLRFDRAGISNGSGGCLLYTNKGNVKYFGGEEMLSGWHHVAVACDAEGYFTVYVDGAEAVRSETPVVRDIPAGTSFYIGTGDLWRTPMMNVDDFIVIEGAATADEVAVLMQSTERGIVELGRPVELGALSHIRGDFNGRLETGGEQTVAGLSGTGPFAEVRMQGDLTVDSAGTDRFRSQLTGWGALVKDGDGELALSSPQDYEGGTKVLAGKLTLLGDLQAVAGRVCSWTFADALAVGHDADSGFDLAVTTKSGASPCATAVEDPDRGQVLSLSGGGYLYGLPGTYPVGFPKGAEPYSMTVSFKADSTGNPGNSGIISWGNRNNRGCHVLRLNGTSGLVVSHWGDNWELNCGDCKDGRWHTVAYSFDGEKSLCYVDGKSYGSVNCSGKVDIDLNGDNGLRLGSWSDVHLKGLIGGLDIYAGALPEPLLEAFHESGRIEVGHSYVAVTNVPAPIVKYDFEDASDPGRDVVGSAHLVSRGNVLTVTDAGRAGRVLDLRAERAYLEAESFPDVLPHGEHNVTCSVSAWVKLAPESCKDLGGVNKASVYDTVLDFGNSSNYLTLCFNGEHRPTVNLRWLSWANARLTSFNVKSGRQLDMWHHVVAVKDHRQDKTFLYFDGSLLSVTSGNAAWNGIGSAFAYLGRAHFNDRDWFRGMIDDVEVYDCALTAEQVSRLCLLESGRDAARRLPAGGDVEIAKGAVLNVYGTDESIGLLTGEGEIHVEEGSSVHVVSCRNFFGKVTGKGTHNIVPGRGMIYFIR